MVIIAEIVWCNARSVMEEDGTHVLSVMEQEGEHNFVLLVLGDIIVMIRFLLVSATLIVG